MPKLKTHKGLAKRVKVSSKGKIKRSKAFKSHLMSGMGAGRRRKLKRKALITENYKRTMLRALGKA